MTVSTVVVKPSGTLWALSRLVTTATPFAVTCRGRVIARVSLFSSVAFRRTHEPSSTSMSLTFLAVPFLPP